ncbi:MAG: PP2C family protein-serine/threonine phosphatase [Nitrospirales bacterium]
MSHPMSPTSTISQASRSDELDGPYTILLVDDEKLVRMLAKRRLGALGHRMLEAEDGEEALLILRREPVDLVLSDWMMPNLDGLGLCDIMKADEHLRNIHFILMTALDKPKELAEGLRRGADDYLPKTASDQEIAARVTAGLRTRQLLLDLEKTNYLLSVKQAELEAELQSGADFVRSVLPPIGEVAPGVRLDWCFLPSLKLGGDLFQVCKWGSDLVGMMILDMSGHGIGSAFRAIALSNFFQEEYVRFRYQSVDPGRILSKLNALFPLSDQGEYFTIWLGVYQWSTGVLRYASAGHPDGILIRKGETGRTLGKKAWPIGFSSDETFETNEIAIQSGDRLYLFSDGIYEVMNAQHEIWGQKRLGQLLEGLDTCSMQGSLQTVVQQSQAWQQKMTFGDDVAVVGVEFETGHPGVFGESSPS